MLYSNLHRALARGHGATAFALPPEALPQGSRTHMCIDPPMPRVAPSLLAISSAITSLTVPPRDSSWQ
jgi:hypothetical protein